MCRSPLLSARIHPALLALLLFAAGGAARAQTSNLPNSPASYRPDVSFTLETHIGAKGMTFRGVGSGIDGVDNPALKVPVDAVVQITLIDGDGAEHDISVPEFKALSNHVVGMNASTVIVFRADKAGRFDYFCTLPGHRQAGMEGRLIVGGATATQAVEAADISRDPADVPSPVGIRGPQQVHFTLTTEEVQGRLADGTSYSYWTFDGKVPGPLLRVRVDDSVTLTLKNPAGSHMIHSIDLHAVTGPGGGAAVMQVPPGQERSFTFKALKPGLYVYHCATPMVAEHISNGMYGMILVEPAGGLPKVNHEFYVMQGELYTTGAYGQHGAQEFDVNKLLDEQPTYFVFNGEVGALTKYHPLHARVGDRVRIFFGVGGPNFTSSFHVIGEIMDRVYEWGSLVSPPVRDVQTVSVPPGGAVMVELTPEVPGKYLLVDHALSRLERGLVGYLEVSGPANPAIYRSDYPPAPGSGH